MSQPGIIYLIQPAEFLNTDIYKIGMSSKETLDRIKSYKKGTRILFIYNCPDPKFFEKSLILLFNKSFDLYKGLEYFRVHFHERKLKQIFLDFCFQTEITHEEKLLKIHIAEIYKDERKNEGQIKYENEIALQVKEAFKKSNQEIAGYDRDGEPVYVTEDEKCSGCNDTGEHIKGGNCGLCGITPKNKIKCNLCNDTGWFEGEEGNSCYGAIAMSKICPAGEKNRIKLAELA